MANQIYAEFGTNCGKGRIDLSTDEIRAALVDTAVYTRNVADGGHALISDIPNGGILSEAPLVNPTYVARIFDADNFANDFPDHGGGATGEELVLYKHDPINITREEGGTATQINVASGDEVHFAPGKQVEVINSADDDGVYNIESMQENVGLAVWELHLYETMPGSTHNDGNVVGSNAASSWLFLNLDTVQGLPVTFDGSDDSITWDNAGIWEFAVACP